MVIDCNNTIAVLDGTGSSVGSDFSYQWTASNGGSILSGEMSLMPEVDSAGTYELVVMNTSNNCSAIAIAIVTIDTLPPMVNAGIDTLVNCTNPTIILEATGSSTGIDFSYEWNTIDGNFVGNNNVFTVEVDSAGSYELTVTNNLTGCTSIDEVIVLENFTTSIADAGVDDELDCNTTSLTIGGTNTSQGTDFIYQWIPSNGGNIVSCLLYTSPSPRDQRGSRMPSSA